MSTKAIEAALNKVAKLKERQVKMAAIFEKSETKRTATIEKLKMLIGKCEKKEGEIAAKKEKVLNDIAAQIVVAQGEEDLLRAEIAKVAAGQAEVKTENPA